MISFLSDARRFPEFQDSRFYAADCTNRGLGLHKTHLRIAKYSPPIAIVPIPARTNIWLR
jgi:hypothetical protein